MGLNLKFNPDEVVLTLSVMSDIHASGSWGVERSEESIRNALKYANEVADNKIDAFLFTGDFTDCMNSKANVIMGHGWPTEYDEAKAYQSKIEFEILRRCFSEEIDPDAEIIYCLGNHDSANCNNTERFITEFASRDEVGDNKNFDRMYRTDTDLEALHQGMRHCVYKDYHFLCVDMNSDRETTNAFLKKNLDEIVAVDPDRYIFVLHHCKVPNMTYASNLWGTNQELHELLKNYPQVVLLAGHTHSPLHNERSIIQRDYTALEVSSVSCITENCVNKPINVTHAMTYTSSQGLLLELDKTGNMRITRLDYSLHCKIKEPWEICRPCGNKVQLRRYTEGRRFAFDPPQFDENFQMQISPVTEGTFISFSQAKHDDMVFRYEIQITDFNGKIDTYYMSSLFCYYPSLDQIPRSVSAKIEHDYSKIYTLSITPQDVWFNSGKTFTQYF